MKLRLPSKVLLTAALGLAFAAGAQAQLNLFNTGVDANANGFDDNYRYLGFTSVGVSLRGPGVNAVIAAQPGFPFSTGDWPAQYTVAHPSAFIMPTPTGTTADGLVTTNPANTTFQFQTTFFFDPSLYHLAGSQIAFDLVADNALSVYLNGMFVGATALDNNVFNFDTQIILNSGIFPGNNVLDFYLTNLIGASGNPAGLRIEQNVRLTLVSPLIPVPEPSTYGLIGASALLGLVVVRRIRSKSAIA